MYPNNNNVDQLTDWLPVLPLSSIVHCTQAAPEKPNAAVQALSFAGGLATTLALLGIASSFAGQAYGSTVGSGLPIVVAVLAVVMGLNLLEVGGWVAVGDCRAVILPQIYYRIE